MELNHQPQHLKRALKNRHIQLIALGGAIGTGLFLGIGQTIKMAGPAVLLGYAITGFIAFLILRQLGEMVVEEPVSGSFSYFAYRYCGAFAGFASGWNYWVLYILVSMAELTAIGLYVHYWWPDLPNWITVTVFFLLINAINLNNVKVYGEMEFWFSLVKVIAIISMISFGAYLLLTHRASSEASITNLWEIGGFMPLGWHGLIMSMAIIMFSFGGLELVGITAAEADNPAKSIPRATNQVIYRILLFYIGSLTVLLALYPWNKVVENSSPFVMIFHELGSTNVANVLNIVVITAALSVYNSAVYSNSRMLYGLARQQNAPQYLTKTNRLGVPYMAILVSALATGSCVIINYVLPNQAFQLLMSLVVSTLVINWIMISYAHLRFRAAKNKEGVTTQFRAFCYPYSNYLCLAFLGGILVVMYMTPGIKISVILIPIWMGVLAISYFLCKKLPARLSRA